ncbi:MAG: NAD(P)H-dependent oxidoreductase [Fibrobacterota bacterium]|nr:NAD(P)H-dependent oxidoreductase [Fibrobacterota bacterium]QQS03711.1 MAG: NAD(P)H-dependent oxidoreductase [Fibrobacterota bacterium]
MSKPDRILILDGHPDPESLCRSLGAAYQKGAIESGAQVRRKVLAELAFDPILHFGFRKRTELEPDLLECQQDILWAEHVVIIHPVWWSNLPALLKGFIDRVFLPGFAFQYRQNGLGWDKLLKGRTGRLIYTQDGPDWYYRWFVGRPSVRALKKGTLEFCGISPVRVSAVGPVRRSSQETREAWTRKMEELGRHRG